ncbi:MAG: exonuclease [Verrucomicrobiaceae bacterium]|nr:MAG: exonuclease [Verrucomicrobiaceae bacterium]
MCGSRVKLSPFYYLEHFEEILSFLQQNCSALMGPMEVAFQREFQALTQEARALLVRVSNRRGTHARVSGLKYAEIKDIPAALALLQGRGFVREAMAADSDEIWGALTRIEVAALLKPLKGLSSKTKPELLEMARRTGKAAVLPDTIIGDFVFHAQAETVAFLLFLYFGKDRRNLQTLALRDLGIVRARVNQSEFEMRYKTREAAVHDFFHARLSGEISIADQAGLSRLADALPSWPSCPDPAAILVRDREICRLGARLEQAGRWDEALRVYGQAAGHPSRERICRILHSRNELDQVKELLERIISQPSTDEELLFAEDFHARKFGGRKLSRLTHMLRSAPVISLDEAFSDSAEHAVKDYLTRQGERAYRTENHLWTALFGLLFWDLLQGENGETKHNQFEYRPTQLTDGTFFSKNEAAIEQQLSKLLDGTALGCLETTYQAHERAPNGVFSWRRGTLDLIRELILHGSPAGIAAVLRRMAKNPMSDSGFPDLMVVGPSGLRFVEVKAEGDQIRRNQLLQIQVMEKEGFAVEIVRVQWIADPDQAYVVVDVETTGGRAAHHRVTEIGAVKVVEGKVVDTFSTLLNPERTIPRNITRLTGISDEMVKNAPKFSEISGSFREFVGDAVFVAHNASFDHGFIRDEYRRMGENFRRPTLCTVVTMRRFFPGLSSYSLASLTTHFSIPLETHHRALCDAKATAGLLQLINGKRMRGKSNASD